MCSSPNARSRRAASREQVAGVAAGGLPLVDGHEERRLLGEVVAVLVDPVPEAVPFGEQCFVGDLDRRAAGRRIAIEREEAIAGERVDHVAQRDHVDVERHELGRRNPPAADDVARHAWRFAGTVAAPSPARPGRVGRTATRLGGRWPCAPRRCARTLRDRAPARVRASNSSVSAYWNSGSAFGWPATSAISRPTRRGSTVDVELAGGKCRRRLELVGARAPRR